MNPPRFVRVLALAALCLAPLAAQESAEVTSLRAKAQRGNAIAQYNLGLAYAKGRGIAQDNIEAFVWLSLAIENGARGKDLEVLVGSLDSGALERARAALADRRAALGFSTPVVTPAATPARTQTTVRTGPAAGPAAGPTPAGPVETQPQDNSPLPALPAGSRIRPGFNPDDPGATGPSESEHQMAGELARTRLQLEALQRELAAERASPTAEKFRRERDALNTRLSALQGDFNTLRADRDRVQRLFTQVQAENRGTAATEHVKALEEKAAAAEAARAEAATRLENFQRELSTLREEAVRLAEERDEARRTASATAARAQELEGRLTGSQAESEKKLAADLRQLREEAVRLAEERDTARQQAAAQVAQVTALQQQLAASSSAAESAQRALAGNREEIIRIAEERDAARRAATEAAARMQDLESRVSSSQTESEKKLAATLDQTRAEAVRLAEERDAARAEATNLGGQVARLERAQAELSRRPAAPAYPDLRGRVGELEQQLAAASQPKAPAYPDLRPRVAELESALQAAGTDMQRLNEFIRDQEQKMVHLREQSDEETRRRFAQAKAEAGNLREQVTRLEGELAAAKDAKPAWPDLRERVAELEQQASARGASNRELTSLREQLAAAQGETGEARTQLQSARQRLERTESQVAALEKQLRDKPSAPAYPDLRERVTALEKQLADGRGAAEAAQAAASRLEGQLAEVRTALNSAQEEALGLARERDAARTSLAGLEKSAGELRSALEQSQRAAIAATAAQRQLATERDNLAATAEDLRKQIAAAGQAPDRSGEIRQLGEQLAAAQRERGEAVAALERQQLAASAAATERQAAESAWQKEREGLRQDLAGLQTRLATASTQLESLAKEAEGRVTEAQIARNVAENTARRAEAQLGETRDRLTAAEQRAQSATTELDVRAQRIATLEQQLQAAGTRSATPAYPDLRERVTELETAVAESLRRLGTAESARSDLEKQLAAAASARPAESPNAQLRRERDELSTRVTDLAGEIAQLRGDRERMQKLLADTGKQLRDAQAGGNRTRELEASLRQATERAAAAETARTEAESRIAQADTAAGTAAQENAALRSRLDVLTLENSGLSEKVSGFAQQVENLQQRLAAGSQPATPSYPDLRGRVAELETALQRAETRSPDYPDLRDRVRELETSLQDAQQSRNQNRYPDLRDRVAELEQNLTQAEARTRAAASANDDLLKQLGDTRAALQAASAPKTDPQAAELRRENAALTERLTQAADEVTQLRTDRERLQRLVADAGRQMRDSSADAARVKELETAVASAQERALAADGARAELAKKLSETELLLEAARALPAGPTAAQHTALQEQLKNSEERLATALRGYSQLEKEVADLKAAATTTVTPAAELGELRNQVASLTTELGRVRAENESARAELGRMTSVRSDAETRLAAVERSALEAARERDTLRSELAAAREAAARPAQQLAQLQAQVEALQTRANDADRRVVLAEGRAATAENDLVRLRQGLASLQGGTVPAARPLSPPTSPTTVATVTPARTHTVAPGDTLSRISQRYYGNAARWPEIYTANAEQLRNASSLTVGMTLRIP